MADNLRLLAEILFEQGYTVRMLREGRMVLSSVLNAPPDLILLDVLMPDLDGYQVCAQLKANEQTRAIPVIFLSALDETADKVKAFAIGGVDYITKPFQPQEVLARVRIHLDLRSLQQRLHAQNLQLQKEIGERQRIQNDLAEERNLLRTLIDTLPDYIFVKDRSSQYILNNAAHLAFFGADTQDAVLGQTDFDRFPQEFATRYYIEEQTLLKTGQALQTEELTPTITGEVQTLLTTKVPFRNQQGAIIGLVGISRDITDHKHAEEQLRASAERYRAIFESILVGVTLIDVNGRFVQVNQRLCDMLGYSDEELLATTNSAVTHPDDDGISEKCLQALFCGEINNYRLEKRYRRKDGSFMWADLAVSPIRDRDGQIIFSNALIMDITDRKAAEVALRVAHEELQQKNAQLQELNVSKDKFFSIIAHDLRSPFTALLGFIELLRDRFETLSSEKRADYFAKLEVSARRLFALLENLLTWARLQRGSMDYAPRTFTITDLVNAIVTLFTSNAEQKQITLTSLTSDVISVYADYAMVNTILRNLVSNAIKFTSAGGRITISAHVVERVVEFIITDTGKGMPPEALANLFRIGLQYSTPGTAGEIGTGLGLILCHDLVQKNGGTIAVESVVGQGTTFRFTLPAGNVSRSFEMQKSDSPIS
jgi:PAS domain S-box-containing protein